MSNFVENACVMTLVKHLPIFFEVLFRESHIFGYDNGYQRHQSGQDAHDIKQAGHLNQHDNFSLKVSLVECLSEICMFSVGSFPVRVESEVFFK